MIVREVQPDDYDALVEFNVRFPGETRAPAVWRRRFAHWWDLNPAFDGSVPRGWIALDDHDRIVGFLGSIAGRFQLGDRVATAVSATSWRVLPEHRTCSMQLYLAHVRSAGPAMLFNSTPSETVERVLQYLHYESRPAYASLGTTLLPIDGVAVARAYLRPKGMVGQVLAGPMGLALTMIGAGQRFMLGRGNARETRVVTNATVEFDELWSRTRARFDNMSVRDRAGLQWWCFGNPDRLKVLICVYEQGTLLGYGAFQPAQWRGLDVLELVDCWTDEGPAGYLRDILSAALRYSSAHGFRLVALHDYTASQSAAYRELGLRIAITDLRRFFYRWSDDDQPVLFDAAGTYLTGMDGDFAL